MVIRDKAIDTYREWYYFIDGFRFRWIRRLLPHYVYLYTLSFGISRATCRTLDAQTSSKPSMFGLRWNVVGRDALIPYRNRIELSNTYRTYARYVCQFPNNLLINHHFHMCVDCRVEVYSVHRIASTQDTSIRF